MTEPTPPTPPPTTRQTQARPAELVRAAQPPSWGGRVAFPRDGRYAVVPGEVIVRVPEGATQQVANDTLARATAVLTGLVSAQGIYDGAGITQDDGLAALGFYRFRAQGGTLDPVAATLALRAERITAQPNHVLFADPFSGNPFSGNPFSGNPFSGNPFSGNPFSGNPFSGNPFSGNPFSGNPFSGNPFSGNPFSGNPFSGNPFSGNPFSGNPFSGNAGGYTYGKPLPLRDPTLASDGRGPNLSRPVAPATVQLPAASGPGPIVAAVIDVGLPAPSQTPALLGHCTHECVLNPAPDGSDLDSDGFLNRVAGHGMFVAGRILQVAPDCEVIVSHALTSLGDGNEYDIATTLLSLLDPQNPARSRVDLVNLSFGGYALDNMEALEAALGKLMTALTPASAHCSNGATGTDHGVVVVASAGNDATDAPPFPAAFPGVVSVGALGTAGAAAFTNYGAWVTACASGVDVPSTFYADLDAAMHTETPFDPDRYRGVATWSGTSFAAPLVVGKLAALMREHKLLPKQAAGHLLDSPGLARFPGLGVIVTD